MVDERQVESVSDVVVNDLDMRRRFCGLLGMGKYEKQKANASLSRTYNL